MDPLSLIVTALATGAAAGLKPTAEKLIKDSYEGLKGLIKRKYEQTNATVPVLERNPASEAGRTVVRESLEAEGAGQDEEVLHQAQAVLRAVRERAPEAAAAIGVRLEDVEIGADLDIRDIVASGGGVDVSGSRVQGSVTIEKVRAGQGPPAEAP